MMNVTGITTNATVGTQRHNGNLTLQKIYSSNSIEFKMLNESAQVRAIETQYASATDKYLYNISNNSGLSDYYHVNADEDNLYVDWSQNVIAGATTNFVYTADITVNQCGKSLKTNGTTSYSHVSLVFNHNNGMYFNARFLIMDGDNNDGIFAVRTQGAGAVERYDTRGANNTMSIAVLVIGKNAYLFVNGELAVAAICIDGNNALSVFSVGMSSMSGSITNQKLYQSGTTQYSEYCANTKVASYQGQYANATTSTTYVDLNA
jgi:hypothetical protein